MVGWPAGPSLPARVVARTSLGNGSELSSPQKKSFELQPTSVDKRFSAAGVALPRVALPRGRNRGSRAGGAVAAARPQWSVFEALEAATEARGSGRAGPADGLGCI